MAFEVAALKLNMIIDLHEQNMNRLSFDACLSMWLMIFKDNVPDVNLFNPLSYPFLSSKKKKRRKILGLIC